MLKLFSAVIVVAISMISITGCAVVGTPVIGTIYTEVKYGGTATGATAAAKEGKACATSILGAIATGDASVTAAKANGGITEVSVIDHTARGVLGVFGEWCTVVRGR